MPGLFKLPDIVRSGDRQTFEKFANLGVMKTIFKRLAHDFRAIRTTVACPTAEVGPSSGFGKSRFWSVNLPTTFFNGSIDEFALFTRVLTPTEIANLAGARPPAPLPSILDDAACPAGDGIPNLIKYALGLNPSAAVSSGLPSARLNGNTFNMQFTRLRDATDITYHVDGQTNLLSGWSELWSSSMAPYTNTAPSDNTGFSLSTTNADRQFLRLRISRP